MLRAGLVSLLLAAAAAAQDPHAARYRQFFKESIEGQWGAEPLSEARVVMVRGFQKHDVPDAAEWLVTEALAKDPAADVVREAVRVLSNFKSPDTVERMVELFEKKLRREEEARALLLHAFGSIKLDTADQAVTLGLKEKDERVCAAACRAVGLGKRLKYRADLEKLLKHKHPAVRGAALEALAELGGEESLPLVFQTFCADASHRVRYDAWRALRKLTLDDEKPCDPQAWEGFWKERAGEGGEGAGPWGTSFPRVHPKARPAASFFQIPLLADRICFVLDITRDMNSPWRIDHSAEREKPPAERIPNFFSVKTRWDLVRSWVKECLNALPEDAEVAFVFFHEKPETWPENGKYLRLSSGNRAKIFKHLDDGVELGSITAMYEGLRAGWGFVKGGDPEANFDKGCDTLVFVTDGRPTEGELKNRPDRLMDECWKVATARQVRFHAVGLYNHQFDLLQGMARDGGGLYVHCQPSDDAAEPQDLEFWPRKKRAFEEARKKK